MRDPKKNGSDDWTSPKPVIRAHIAGAGLDECARCAAHRLIFSTRPQAGQTNSTSRPQRFRGLTGSLNGFESRPPRHFDSISC